MSHAAEGIESRVGHLRSDRLAAAVVAGGGLIESRVGRLRRDRLAAAGVAAGGGLIRPVGAAITSLVVARGAGLGVLGEVVRVQIVVQMAALVAQWGGRQAVVRAMATESGRGSVLWRAELEARLRWLVPPAAVLVAVLVPARLRVVAVLWFGAAWFIEMVEGRVTVGRRFVPAAVVDLAVLSVSLVVLTLVPTVTVAVVEVYAAAAVVRAVTLWWVTRPIGERGDGAPEVVGRRRRREVGASGLGRLRGDSPLAGASLAGYGQSRGAVVMAAATLGPASLAVFSVLANLIQVARSAVALLHRPHAPALHRLRTPSVLVFARSQLLLVAPPVLVLLAFMVAVAGRMYGFGPEARWLLPAGLAVVPLVWRMPVTLRLFGTDRAGAVWWSTVVVAAAVLAAGRPVLSGFGIAGGLWLLAGSELAMTVAALAVVRSGPVGSLGVSR